MGKVITIGMRIAVVLSLFALPAFAQSFKEGDRYSDGNFYVHFENQDTLSFLLPKYTPIGPITVAGRGKYKLDSRNNIYSVKLESGYFPPSNLSDFCRFLGATTDGSTEFLFDYGKYRKICYPSVYYYRKKKLVRALPDSVGHLRLLIEKNSNDRVIEVTVCGLGQHRIPIDSIIGKKVVIRVAPEADESRVIFYDRLRKVPRLDLQMLNYNDSLRVNCDGFDPSVTLFKN